ncbi:MAG: hypothetical protein HY340_02095 [Candidatus Kerfeldbacteria bacterium]|nr:hypothetical protein [Candidatus Kerfeldbacteria bacterium]
MNVHLSVFVIVALMGIAPAAIASGSIELQNVFTSDGEYDPTVDALIGERFNGGSIGWSAFLLTCQGWSEAVVGPTWAPASWLELWSGVGVETDDDPFRFAGSVWMGDAANSRSLLFVREEGGSGHWNKGIAKVRIGETATTALGLGVHYQTPYGIGPHLSFEGDLGQIWASPLYDADEGPTVILGLVRSF